MILTQLDQILTRAKSGKTRRIAVAAAADLPVLKALQAAVNIGVVKPVLIGERKKITELAKSIKFQAERFEIIDVEDAAEAAIKAVALVKSGEADILMKGMVSTAPFLKAILDKEKGLRKRSVLSHLAIFQTSYYHKLLGATDAAMNIAPSLDDKISIIENAVEVFHQLGIANPKVAALGPVEVVNEKIPSTVDAAALKKMNREGKLTGCLLDGPFAVDNAVSAEAARHKGIVSEVAGDADILLAPGLDSGNILYKTMMFLSDGRSAAIITGASAPVVLTSRADSEESKLYSIALAAAL